MKQLFADFREDDEEQKQLNIQAAIKNVGPNQTEAEKKLLIDEGLSGFVPEVLGNTKAPGVELGIGIGAAALAKPVLAGSALTATGKLIRKYPGKSLEVGLTGLSGASDDPRDKAMETTGYKLETMFSGPSPLRLAKLINDVFPEQVQGGKRFFSNLFGQKQPVTPEGVEVPNTFFMSKSDDAQGISKKGFNPNITKKNLELFNQIGWTGTAKLDIQDMLYGIDDAGKPLMSQYRRRVLKAGIGDETFNWGAFTKNRDAVVKDFLDGMQDLNIDPKTIHGHHISALRITSSLFDGLSPIQRKKLIKIFQREGLQLGNHPKNLMALHTSTHLDVVHPFLEQQIGKYGQLLIDPAKIKKLNPRQREGLVKKFAKIIKRSEEIAMENTRTWLDDAFEGLSPEAAFDARMDILNKAFDDDIAFREQLLKSVKSEEPLLPYQAEDVEISVTPKPKTKRVTSKQTKFKNLLKKIKTENPSWNQMTIWELSDESLDAYRKLF